MMGTGDYAIETISISDTSTSNDSGDGGRKHSSKADVSLGHGTYGKVLAAGDGRAIKKQPLTIAAVNEAMFYWYMNTLRHPKGRAQWVPLVYNVRMEQVQSQCERERVDIVIEMERLHKRLDALPSLVGGGLPEADCVSIVMGLLLAVSELNGCHGYAHCDIKMGNVMLRDGCGGRPQVVLIDYGSAIPYIGRGVAGAPAIACMTFVTPELRHLIGSTAEEGIMKVPRECLPAVDAWMTGAVIHSLVFGTRMHSRTQDPDDASALLERYGSPSTRESAHVRALVEVVDGMLQPDPQRRLSATAALHSIARACNTPQTRPVMSFKDALLKGMASKRAEGGDRGCDDLICRAIAREMHCCSTDDEHADGSKKKRLQQQRPVWIERDVMRVLRELGWSGLYRRLVKGVHEQGQGVRHT